MTFMRSGFIVVAASVLGMGACRYSEPPKEPEASSSDAPPPPKEDESTSEAAPPADDAPAPPTGACDDRTCSVDQDCCTGYGCALDPERSRVQRYCLAQ